MAPASNPVETPDGRVLGVREGGDPAGVPVLVLNGTPSSSLLYEPNVRDAAERGIRLIAYDRPGYAGSTRDRGRTVADCAKDVAAAAALAPVAPFDAEGLDFYDGMGEQNIEEFGAIFEGEDAHLAVLERDRQELLSASPEELAEAWRTLLGPSDVQVLSGRVAAFLLDNIRIGIEDSLAGWFDDDVAFARPWGFDLASIRVPVLHWQGAQDKLVPFGHGVWLSERIPGVDSHLTPDDGHLTLYEHRIPEVHAWLYERF